MCAINPKHQMHFKLSVYTSWPISKEMFDNMVMRHVTEAEQRLNSRVPELRFHISELPNEEIKS